MSNAFTLLEGLLSIIIIGILSFLFIPNQKDNTLILAKNQLIEDINIAVLKASTNDTFQNNKEFYPDLWQIKFNKKIKNQNVIAYSIYANIGKSKTLNKKDKTITNPLNYKSLTAGGYYGLDTNKSSKEVMISKLYKVDNLKLSKNCSKSSSMKLLFDSLGKIHINNRGKLAKGICEISLFQEGVEAKICVDTETSFVYSC